MHIIPHNESPQHLAGFHALRSNAEVMRYIPVPRSTSLEESRLSVEAILANPQEYLFAVISDRKIYMGMGGILSKDQSNAEIGCSFLPDYWGKGYATELLHWLIHYSFQTLGLRELRAVCEVRNSASVKSLENIGMRKEQQRQYVNPATGNLRDEWVFCLSKSEKRGD